MYLEKWHTVFLTFTTGEYNGDGGDSLEKKGLWTFSIPDKAFLDFETEEGEGTICFHSFILSFVHLFEEYRDPTTLVGAGSKTDQKFLFPWSSFLDR